MNIKITRVAAAAALAVGAMGAQASTVVLTDFTFTPAAPLTVGAPSYSGHAGQFTGTLDGASFVTWCTEITQSFAFNTAYDYTVVDGVTAWGAKANTIGQILTAYSGYVNNAAHSAVVQAAIWEVLYETSGTYGFGTGTFKATSSDAATNTALGDIDWASLSGVKSLVKVDQLYNRSHQNFLVTTPVPEPETYALMAAGLAGVSFVVRRRSRRD